MAHQVQKYIAEIQALMETKLWVKGRDLKAQTRKAGRRLPRKVRRDLRYLIDTAPLAENPKLGRMINQMKVDKAYANITAHLEQLNPREAMWTMLLNITASIALGLILIFVVVLYVLVQRGYV